MQLTESELLKALGLHTSFQAINQHAESFTELLAKVEEQRKLLEEQVVKLREEENAFYAELAEKYGVSIDTAKEMIVDSIMKIKQQSI